MPFHNIMLSLLFAIKCATFSAISISGTASIVLPRFLLALLFMLTLQCISNTTLRKTITAIIIVSTGTLYLIAYNYQQYFHIPLHLKNAFVLWKEGAEVSQFFVGFLDWKSITLIIDIPLLTYMMLSKNNIYIKKFNTIITIAFIGYFLIKSINPNNSYNLYHQLTKYKSLNEEQEKNHYGIELFSYNEIKYDWIFANLMELAFDNKGEAELVNIIHYGPQQVFIAQSAPNNVILIQVESLGSGMPEMLWHNQPVMPYLYQKRKRNYIPYTMSYHLAGGTSDAEIAILNSIEPIRDFATIKLKAYNYPNSLVQALKNSGYSTKAFHGNAGDYFNRFRAFAAMGFDHFYDKNQILPSPHPKPEWGARDHEVFAFAEQAALREKQPFFYHIITMTSHGPFQFTDPFFTCRDFDDIKNPDIRGYFKSMRYVDESIKKFVQFIQEKIPNTKIVIVGDHSPGFPQNAYYQNPSYHTPWGYLEFVPLFILDSIRQISNTPIASFLDLAPTLLDLSQAATTIKSDGLSLLSISPRPNLIVNQKKIPPSDLLKFIP